MNRYVFAFIYWDVSMQQNEDLKTTLFLFKKINLSSVVYLTVQHVYNFENKKP